MSETTTDPSDDALVSRTFAAAPLRVWEVLISAAGAEALLGEGARLGSKGESWQSSAGPMGVVRSVHPLEQLRVSWHEDPDAPNTVVKLDLTEDGGSTRIDLLHSGFTGDAATNRQRWSGALDRVGSLL